MRGDQQCQKSEPESFKEVKISEKTNKQRKRVAYIDWDEARRIMKTKRFCPKPIRIQELNVQI